MATETPAPVAPAPALVRARRLPESNSLELAWSDGHAARFPVPYLRGYCPCAVCQGHHATRIVFHAPRGPQPVALASIQPVGRYGLSLGFSDGHATGIYRFDFLRRICPCADCRAERRRAAAALSPSPMAEDEELLAALDAERAAPRDGIA